MARVFIELVISRETNINNIITLLNVKLETEKYCEEKLHGSTAKADQLKSP